jgi:hypothetical protein
MNDFSLYTVIVSGGACRDGESIVAHFTNKTAAREYAHTVAKRGFTVEWHTEGAAINNNAARAIEFLNAFTNSWES